MKELSIEEKAKRYDYAIKRAEEYHKEGKTLEYADDLVRDLFPELKESDDEGIRKALISILKSDFEKDTTIFGISVGQIIAWLKKPQGELTLEAANEEKVDNQNYVKSKFKDGDWVMWDNKISWHINDVYQGKNSLMYTITDTNNMTCSYSVKGFDNNTHLWTIQDAKDGDVLAVENMIFIYKTVLASHIVSYCKLFNDKFEFFNDTRTCCEGNSKVHPATKEQRALLFQKMKETGYEWDAKKKELKKTEQKPDWSEEDNNCLSTIIAEFSKCAGKSVSKDEWMRCNDFLNSLKDRIQPKQEWSEEDEYVFNKVLNWMLIVNPTSSIFEKLPKEQFIERFKSIRLQINVTDEELAQAKKDAYNDALDKIEYHSGEPTFDDGWSAAIWYLKKRNAQFNNTWRPSDEQMKGIECTIKTLKYQLNAGDNRLDSLYSDLKKLRGE